MADVFISYKREDRRAAERLSIALEQLGFDVWWDFDLISGDQFRRVIEKVIDECAAVVVLWSALSRESTFVVDEAAYAKEQGKLCPARIDDCRLPLGFGGDHVVSLRDWDGEMDHEGLQALVRALEHKTGKKARLGARARDAEDEARFAEMEAFKAAQAAENASALRAFLHEYPEGAFAKFVRGQLVEMTARAGAEPSASSPQRGEGSEGVRAEQSASPPSAPAPARRPPPAPSADGAGGRSAAPRALIGAGALLAVVVLVMVLRPSERAAVVEPPPDPVIEEAQAETPPARDVEAETETTRAPQAQTEPAAASAPQAHDARPTQTAAQPAQRTEPAPTTSPQFAPYDLALLHPDVRRAVEAARAIESRAEGVAARAREAALRAEDAARRARAGERGYRVLTETFQLRPARYEGGWVNGARSGFGVVVFLGSSPGRYAGQWSEGVWSGVGVYTYPEWSDPGAYLICEYTSGRCDGVQILDWGPNKQDRFVGEVANGSRDGFGVRTSSGVRYEGQWRSERYDGHGVLWDEQGRVRQQGIWETGNLITALRR